VHWNIHHKIKVITAASPSEPQRDMSQLVRAHVGGRVLDRMAAAQRVATGPKEARDAQTPAADSSSKWEAWSLLARGKEAARRGDPGSAFEFLLAAAEYDPQQPDTWLWLAAVAPSREVAINCLHTALHLQPGNPHALQGLAYLGEAGDN
jgi:hypothetical protein